MGKNINWKKEGYAVGDKALLISRNFYALEKGRNDTEQECEISYVGRTILKVKDLKLNKTYTFSNSRATSGLLIGDIIRIYKNKEEYTQKIIEETERDNLITSIIPEIRYLSIDNLRKINKIIGK